MEALRLFLLLLLNLVMVLTNSGESEFKQLWCPGQCLNSSNRLCDRHYLFIISTGRSGSTTLLKSLRLVHLVRIIGETNILSELETLYNGAIAIQIKRGHVDENEILLRLQRLYNLLHQSDISNNTGEALVLLGSKEVHLASDMLPFIRKLFPCSRFIFNYRRNVEKQSQSAFHKLSGSTVEQLRENTAALLRAHDRLPFVSTTIALEDFSLKSFDSLLRWMGLMQCRFTDIGHYNYNGTYRPATSTGISGDCVFKYD